MVWVALDSGYAVGVGEGAVLYEVYGFESCSAAGSSGAYYSEDEVS